MRKKQNIEPKNADGDLHGLCICYWRNDNLWLKMRYVDGIAHGIIEEYLSNGDLCYKSYSINREIVYNEVYRGHNIIEFGI